MAHLTVRTAYNNLIDRINKFPRGVIAAILGVILKLPPLKQILASNQMKSHYLEYLLANYEKK